MKVDPKTIGSFYMWKDRNTSAANENKESSLLS